MIGGAKLPIDKFTLREDGAKEPIELHATTKRDFMQGSETVAIALVMNTWEVWVGNDDVTEESDPSRYQGVLKGLSQALDGVKFTEAGPPGSQGTLITYADKAAVKIKMGPLSNITGSALGSQKDYFGTKGVEMVKGIELAMGKLHEVTAARKVLIIVCDGNDTNNEAAKVALRHDRDLALQDRIQTFAIVYKSALSDPAQVIGNFTSSLTTVNTAENIASTIAAILSRMNDRYYLTFPGFDPKTGLGPVVGRQGPQADPQDRQGRPGDPVEVTMAPVWSPPKHGSWLWLFIVIGAARVAAGFHHHHRRRDAEEADPDARTGDGRRAGAGAAQACGADADRGAQRGWRRGRVPDRRLARAAQRRRTRTRRSGCARGSRRSARSRRTSTSTTAS